MYMDRVMTSLFIAKPSLQDHQVIWRIAQDSRSRTESSPQSCWRKKTFLLAFANLRTATTHRLKGKCRGGERHDDKQGRTDVDRRRGGSVRVPISHVSVSKHKFISQISRRRRRIRTGRESLRSNDGAHDTHDAVDADSDAVAGTTVSRGQDFGSVGV